MEDYIEEDATDFEYDDDDGDSSDNGIEEDENYYHNIEDASSSKRISKTLEQDDIDIMQSAVIQETSALLSVCTGEASLLLRYYNWEHQQLTEEWFTDEARVREKTGVVISLNQPVQRHIFCNICFEPSDEARYALCKEHGFCKECWVLYLETAISDGPGCVTIRCPQPKCRAAVPDAMVISLVASSYIDKFKNYLLKSFVESRRNLKWCPAPGCKYVVEEGDDAEVTCKCLALFCWGCLREPHRPLSCELATKWIEKNHSEAENATWMTAYTKPCPKCKRPIEKNLGCMHMTCRAPCHYEFCWICLNDWTKHADCNTYKGEETVLNDRHKARVDTQRYAHFFARFTAHCRSQEKAAQDLLNIPTILIQLGIDNNIERPQLEFIVDGWKEIVRSRRILKWVYAYGYYLCSEKDNDGKIQLYNHQQEAAVTSLERLHECVEKEMKDKVKERLFFMDYKQKVVTLIRATRDYMENLANSLEIGLIDVDVVSSRENALRDRAWNTLKAIWAAEESWQARLSAEEGRGWMCEGCKFVNTFQVPDCEVCLLSRDLKKI